MKKETKLNILTGSVCAVLGVAAGYSLYSLRKTISHIQILHITNKYMNHYGEDLKPSKTDNKQNGRQYVYLGSIKKKEASK